MVGFHTSGIGPTRESGLAQVVLAQEVLHPFHQLFELGMDVRPFVRRRTIADPRIRLRRQRRIGNANRFFSLLVEPRPFRLRALDGKRLEIFTLDHPDVPLDHAFVHTLGHNQGEVALFETRSEGRSIEQAEEEVQVGTDHTMIIMDEVSGVNRHPQAQLLLCGKRFVNLPQSLTDLGSQRDEKERVSCGLFGEFLVQVMAAARTRKALNRWPWRS